MFVLRYVLREQWDQLALSNPGCQDTQSLKPTRLYNRSATFPQSVTNHIITFVEKLTFHDPSTSSAKMKWYDPRLGVRRQHEGRWTSMHKDELAKLILSRYGCLLLLDHKGNRILNEEGELVVSRRKMVFLISHRIHLF